MKHAWRKASRRDFLVRAGAANIALGRDAAGVHYRSDSIQGLFVGEQVAIGLLRDYSRTYRERFDGFVFTRFDGQKVRIRDGATSRA